MSVCSIKSPKFNPDKSKYIQKYINTKVDIDQSIPFGFTSSVTRNGETNIYTYGKRDIEEDLPFEEDSIYRMASQSKFMGVVGFLKLVDKGAIKLDDLLKDYIPEYSKENMGVINPYKPNGYEKTLMNPIKTTKGSNHIHIQHNNHPFKVGDTISIEWANGSLGEAEFILPDANGIPGFEIFNVHVILGVDKNGYSITTSTLPTKTGMTGSFLKIRSVDPGTHRSIVLSPDTMMVNPKVKTHYYMLGALERDITILDVLTHGLGWAYYSPAMLYMSFGYSCDTIKRDIQAGIWNELGLPVGLPVSSYGCDIKNWARTAAKIPLLYQPAKDWSYGPQLSILGSLIEIIDGRKVENYMMEEIWDPLGMEDTGFYLHESDPNYKDKVDRMAKLYINMPKIVIKLMGSNIPFPPIYEAQNCLHEGPKNLCLVDSGMYTTPRDYLKFLKMFLNGGRTDSGQVILSPEMINTIGTYHVDYDVNNLSSVSGYSSGLSVPISGSVSDIKRQRLLTSIKWGLGVGTIQGCNNMLNPNKNDKNIRAITWAGVLGTRFIIDFCSGVAYNGGTNVIGPPAGTFDSDLIELNYKEFDKEGYKRAVREMLL